MVEDCVSKLSQKEWFDLGEFYYHGATLKECEAKYNVSVYCIAKHLTELTGIAIRPRNTFNSVNKSSEPEYEQETLARHKGEHASGRAPWEPAEEPVENPRKIVGV